jgi:hypothetical protein
MVNVEIAGIGIRRVRVAGLPPEVPKSAINDALAKYGEVKKITEEHWPRAYRYTVNTGTRWVDIGLQKYIPSHMNIVRNRVIIT